MSEITKQMIEEEDEMNMTPMIDIVFNLLIFFMVVSDLTQKELANLTLPLAHTAVEDEDNDKDDRVILNIDDKGQLLYKGNAISLDELGARLSNAKRLYDIKQTRKGEDAYEMTAGGKASKLFVLLRADRNTPWQHVQWVMTIMAEQKLYKLQFATKIFADSKYSKGEKYADGRQVPDNLVEMLGGKWQGEDD